MHKKFLLAGVVVAAVAGAPSAQAQLIQVTANVGGQTQVFNFNSLDAALAQLTGPNLSASFPGYRDGDQVAATVDFNGAPLNLLVPRGTTTPILSDPRTGQAIAFPSSNSSVAVANYRAFFVGQPNNGVPVSQLPASVLNTLPAGLRNAPPLTASVVLQSAVATTISDPVAGNPTSLMPQMASADYNAAGSPTGDMLGVNQPRGEGWRFNAGVRASLTTASGADTQSLNVPLRGSYYFAKTATEVFLDAPISWVSISSVDVLQASTGIGVLQRLMSGSNYEWNATLGARWGIAGSQSYGRGSAAIGGSISSDLRLALPARYTLTMTNTAAYYQTQAVNYGGGSVDYNLQNQFYRNGLMLARPLGTTPSGLPLQGGLTFVQTNVTGDRFRINSWQEYGVVVAMGGRLPTRFSVSYMNGQHNFQAVRFGFTTAF
ncbi:MAG: hypothetical protein WCP77_13700 [Roseococcus sp.]